MLEDFQFGTFNGQPAILTLSRTTQRKLVRIRRKGVYTDATGLLFDLMDRCRVTHPNQLSEAGVRKALEAITEYYGLTKAGRKAVAAKN